MTTIYFTKRFTSGPLAGLSVPASLTLLGTVRGKDEARRCYEAIRIGKVGRDCVTGTKWVVTDASFQSFHR